MQVARGRLIGRSTASAPPTLSLSHAAQYKSCHTCIINIKLIIAFGCKFCHNVEHHYIAWCYLYTIVEKQWVLQSSTKLDPIFRIPSGQSEIDFKWRQVENLAKMCANPGECIDLHSFLQIRFSKQSEERWSTMDADERQGSSSHSSLTQVGCPQLSTTQNSCPRLSTTPCSCPRLSTTQVDCLRLSTTQTIYLQLSLTLVDFPPLLGRTQLGCHRWWATNPFRDISSKRLPQATSWHSTFQGRSKHRLRWPMHCNNRGVFWSTCKISSDLRSRTLTLHWMHLQWGDEWAPPRNMFILAFDCFKMRQIKF